MATSRFMEGPMSEVDRRSLLIGVAATGAIAALGGIAVESGFAAVPPVGKQAPSFYRYKIGSFEVTAVADGVASSPLPENYVANVPKFEVSKHLAADFLPPDRINHPYIPTVINTGSKLVVIDTGAGQTNFEQSKGAVGQFHTNLRASGIDPNDVDVVLLSHLHTDHINGLIGSDNKPVYPKAEIIVPDREWAFWSDESNASRVPEMIRGQFANVKRVFGVFGNKVTRLGDGKDAVPGITAMATPGHTPGHTSFMVSSGNAKLLVQADVVAGVGALFVRNPDWQLVWDLDKEQAVQTRRRVYDMASADRLPVQGFHLPFPGVGHIEKSGNGYRFVPVFWNTSL
jgi:glyoxylase-like metal-dependent hydrolase (beta-lactamase superfamily II)